jgi:hypothetical protein
MLKKIPANEIKLGAWRLVITMSMKKIFEEFRRGSLKEQNWHKTPEENVPEGGADYPPAVIDDAVQLRAKVKAQQQQQGAEAGPLEKKPKINHKNQQESFGVRKCV